MQTILSIIIPVYNVEKYIKMTLDSIFSQNNQREDIEVIVVNDGTPDHSMDVVAPFAETHSNLRIINQDNQGLSGARNTGIREAHGKYIWFVDSDDMIEEGILGQVLPLLENGEEDVYIFRIKEINENNDILKERHFLDDKNVQYYSGFDVINNMSRHDVFYTPMQIYMINTVFLRRNNLKFVCGIYHEDMEFAPRMLVFAHRIAYVPYISYCYVRRSAQSITSDISKLEKRLCDLNYIADRHYTLMKEQNTKYSKKAIGFAVYRAIAYYHLLCPKTEFRLLWKRIERNNIPIKKIVIMNLNHNRHWRLLFRQLLFLISPYLLKKLGKSI